MIKAKQVSINKNKYHTININDLDPFLLDIKKKSSKDIDIYYINYIQGNLNNSNSLHIKIDSATWYFKEKNDEKYLIFDLTKEYEKVWSGIRSEIERINGGKKVFYEKNYRNIGINTEDDLPMKESLKFLKLCEICSKLTIKIPERRRRSGIFMVNFEHISHLVLVFLLLTLNM